MTKREWRPFKEARKFARGLGLTNQREWAAWSKSGQRPPDIPTNPQTVYKGEWRDWGTLLVNERRMA